MRMNVALESFSRWRSLKIQSGTVKSYDRYLRYLALYLHDPHLSDITLDQISGYYLEMKRMGWDQNTVMVHAQALRKFLEYLRLQGVPAISEELVPLPRRMTKMPKFANEEKYQKLLASIPDNNDPRHIRNAALIRMYGDTGARNSEIINLNIADIDFARHCAVIRTAKAVNRPFREIFWTAETQGFIDRWLEVRDKLRATEEFIDRDAIFISITGDKHGHRLKITGVGCIFRKASERAGLDGCLNCHQLRHRRAHIINDGGGSNSDIANILGHSTITSTLIYTMYRNRELEAKARSFLGH